MNTLRLYKSRTGYRWTYLHRNGNKLANGCQGYSRKCDTVKAIRQSYPDFLTGVSSFFIYSRHEKIEVRIKDETLTGRARK